MSDTEARDKLVCAEEDALVERIARILFLDDMQPDTTQTGNRLWKRLCEQTNHNSEWHHTARRVIDGLNLDIISSRHSLDGLRHRYDLTGHFREDA